MIPLIIILLYCSIFTYLFIRFPFRGSDHHVHLLLIHGIQKNNKQLLTHLPNHLCKPLLGYPLFLHKLLSLIGDKKINAVSSLINPLSIFIQLLFQYYYLSKQPNLSDNLFTIIILFTIFTPQYLNASNARNSGISARPFGTMLLSGLLFSFILYLQLHYTGYLLACIFFAFMIWGSSKFAQQTMLGIALLYSIFYQNIILLLVSLSGLALLQLLFPPYCLSYIKGFSIYLHNYYKYLQDKFINKIRYSIWQDFLHELWIRDKTYRMHNPAVIILWTNILCVFSPWAYINSACKEIWMQPCFRISLCGLLLFLLTSFRKTRFLGEPERYVEAIIPFGIITSITYLWHYPLILLAIGIFYLYQQKISIQNLFFTGNQNTVSFEKQLNQIHHCIREHAKGKNVRFFSNNNEMMRYLLNSDWDYFLFWNTDYRLSGLLTTALIKHFPYYNPNAITQIIQTNRINYYLKDKNTPFPYIHSDHSLFSNCLLRTKNYELYYIN